MQSFHHLSQDLTPKDYTLVLKIHQSIRKFEGIVTIEATSRKKTSQVVLHAKDLTIKKALINGIPCEGSFRENDECVLDIGIELTTKKLTIVLEFSGNITDTMHGLYPSYYEMNGIKKELLSTQLEAHHARELFPCIDEPAAKARFTLTLHTDADMTVLGNMPIAGQTKEKDILITTFEKSPIMSTYLLAFVIGDLQSVKTHTKNGVEVSIWSTKAHSKKDLDFACQTAKCSIEFFDSYFATPYPLPKADYVAIPDFSSGAMENWGLMTYREICLLVNPRETSVATKQQVATVIAHETAHQWFGNLVTMKWWDDLWLNESFANMMEYVAVDALFPDWHIWEEFAAHESLLAKRRDALPGVQPVKIAVNHPDEINTLFDPAIVYAKGGNLLYMLKNYIGEKAFVDGLKLYFERHAYANTTGDDLWQAWSEVSSKDIGSFMKPWLEQSGFPVIFASLVDTTLHVRQKHFRIGEVGDDRLWTVPLFCEDASAFPVLSQKEARINVSNKKTLKLNREDQGYFITQYDQHLEKLLLANISSFGPIDRLQYLSDVSLLGRGRLKKAAEFFEILEAYRHETAQPVWDLIALLMSDLKRLVENDTVHEPYLKKYVSNVVNSIYQAVGWDIQKDEPENTAKLRATATGLALYGEKPVVINEALTRYESISDIRDLNPELRSSIIGARIKHGDNVLKECKKLIAYYGKTSSSDIQIDIAAGLTATTDPQVGRYLLSLLGKDPAIIRAQDVPRWFAYLIRNSKTRQDAWQWLKDNWHWVDSTYKNDHHYDVFAYYTASVFSTKNELTAFTEFFTDKRHELALKRTIDIGIKEIEARIDWIDYNQTEVTTRLREMS